MAASGSGAYGSVQQSVIPYYSFILHYYSYYFEIFRCKHYRRRCAIRAPCCNQIFRCRHCHNDAADHVLPRHAVTYVICLNCEWEQPALQTCLKCGVVMGKYFCDICKFYDDDVSKGQFHCEKCEICRVGGEMNFFHCDKCGCCISIDLIDNHVCFENSLKHDCALCFEYLFDTLIRITVLSCGHTIHSECLKEIKEKQPSKCLRGHCRGAYNRRVLRADEIKQK